MKYYYGLVLCVLMVGIGTFALGEKDMEKQVLESKSSIPKLASLKGEERMKLLGQLSKDYFDLQGQLISQLDPSSPKEVNFSIAYLLGLYRMEQSVRHLSKYITLEADVSINKRLPLWDRYPVVEALIRIGSPAVPEMIKNIETSDDEKTRELSARVIRYVEGHDIAKIVLEKAMEKQSDPAKKAKLKTAMESIEK